jgi:hypothetical protein
MLTCLLTGTAYSEQLPNKPFKVCGEKPIYPCVALGPTATVAHRITVPDTKDQEIKRLQEENAELRKLLDTQLGKTQESKKTEP